MLREVIRRKQTSITLVVTFSKRQGAKLSEIELGNTLYREGHTSLRRRRASERTQRYLERHHLEGKML